MMKLFSFQSMVAVAAIAIISPSTPALAAEIAGVDIHGYGAQTYLRSKQNAFDGADAERDSFDSRWLALVFTANLGDRAKAWAQLHASDETRLDWAFVDYQFTPNLVGKAGKVQLPLGLFNQTRDARFLQLSTQLPFLYQDGTGIADESYQGISAVYDHALGGGTALWDLYVGQGVAMSEFPARVFKRLVGGRLTYKLPVPGLRAMLSAYRSSFEDRDDPTNPVAGAQKTIVLSADYDWSDLDLKSEFGRTSIAGVKRKTWYVQGGYTVAEKWTPFVRYDYVTLDDARRNDVSYFQKSSVLGLNYKVSSSLALRAENHFNRGYAFPVEGGTVSPGTGKDRWNFFTASVTFIF